MPPGVPVPVRVCVEVCVIVSVVVVVPDTVPFGEKVCDGVTTILVGVTDCVTFGDQVWEGVYGFDGESDEVCVVVGSDVGVAEDDAVFGGVTTGVIVGTSEGAGFEENDASTDLVIVDVRVIV